MPKSVICDRPYVYAIVDTLNMNPIFIGTVNNVDWRFYYLSFPLLPHGDAFWRIRAAVFCAGLRWSWRDSFRIWFIRILEWQNRSVYAFFRVIFIPNLIYQHFGMTKLVRLCLFLSDIHSKSELSAFWNEKSEPEQENLPKKSFQNRALRRLEWQIPFLEGFRDSKEHTKRRAPAFFVWTYKKPLMPMFCLISGKRTYFYFFFHRI